MIWSSLETRLLFQKIHHLLDEHRGAEIDLLLRCVPSSGPWFLGQLTYTPAVWKPLSWLNIALWSPFDWFALTFRKFIGWRSMALNYKHLFYWYVASLLFVISFSCRIQLTCSQWIATVYTAAACDEASTDTAASGRSQRVLQRRSVPPIQLICTHGTLTSHCILLNGQTSMVIKLKWQYSARIYKSRLQNCKIAIA